MNTHPVVVRLRTAGFDVVPVLNMHGVDTGVLAWRRDPDDLVVVTAWSDDFAVGARMPRRQDWARPFAASARLSLGPVSFSDLVEQVLDESRLSESVDCASPSQRGTDEC